MDRRRRGTQRSRTPCAACRRGKRNPGKPHRKLQAIGRYASMKTGREPPPPPRHKARSVGKRVRQSAALRISHLRVANRACTLTVCANPRRCWPPEVPPSARAGRKEGAPQVNAHPSRSAILKPDDGAAPEGFPVCQSHPAGRGGCGVAPSLKRPEARRAGQNAGAHRCQSQGSDCRWLPESVAACRHAPFVFFPGA